MNLIRNYLLMFAFIITGCSVGSQEDEQGVIVSGDWLSNRIEDPSLALLHVGSREVYDSVHIPGARHIDPYDFTLSTDSLSNELPPIDTIVALLNSAYPGLCRIGGSHLCIERGIARVDRGGEKNHPYSY